MDEIVLVRATAEYAALIENYRAEFPADRERVTLEPERIPGLDHLEEYGSVEDWLAFCASMAGKISWYLAVRRWDGKAVGCCCLRHALEYDDDDGDFASHIGYSVRPSERRKGYAKEQLRLLLREAKAPGLERVRIICLAGNAGSNRAILANGGMLIDTVTGEESGLTVNRYDIPLNGL